MADLKVTQLGSLGAVPANNDLLMVVDVSDTAMSAGGTNKQVTANYVGRTSGAIIYAQDDKALTLPASGTAALRGVANTFTATQTITMPTGAVEVNIGLYLANHDNGDRMGPGVFIGSNNNGSTPGAGVLAIARKTNVNSYIWPDSSGLLRIGPSRPTGATDTSAGSVVGDQTSMLEAKTLAVRDVADIATVRERIRQGADAVRRWTYKDGEYNGEEFEGVVTDFAPAYGKDRDKEHPNGKALNNIVILGDLLRAVAALDARVVALEGLVN